MALSLSELERLAQDRPSDAYLEADRRASQEDEPHQRAGWLRIKGLAAGLQGRLEEAEAILEAALSDASDDSDILGMVETTLGGVVALRGDGERALAVLDAAVERLSGPLQARAIGQRGTVLNRLGRRQEAAVAFDTAIADLAGDDPFLRLMFNNRAILAIEAGSVTAGIADLERAAGLAEESGQDNALAEVTHNLGWASHLLGDLPAALDYFDRAEAMFRRLNYPLGEPLRDRARALLDAGLGREALRYAIRSAELLEGAGMAVSWAEGLVVLARAALLSGDLTTAAETAGRAVELLVAQGRVGWAATAEALLLEIEERRGVEAGSEADLDRLRDVIGRLDACGLADEAAEARLTAGRFAIRLGYPEQGRAWLGQIVSGTSAASALRRSLARALIALSRDDHAAAARMASAGLVRLGEWRATVGTVEMRTSVSVHAAQLASIGIRMAVESGRARRLFDWIERGRAASLRHLPLHPREDTELADDLARLRLVRGRQDEAERQRGGGADLHRQVAAAEEAVRRRIRRSRGSGSERSVTNAGAVMDRIGQGTLVQLALVDNRMMAVILTADRVTRLDLGTPAAALAAATRAGRRLSATADPGRSTTGRAAAAASVESDVAVVAEMVGPALVGDGPLVIIPSTELHSFAWPLVPQLRERTITVVPSATAWMAARDRRSRIKSVLVASGPRLIAAAGEVESVAALHVAVSVLAGSAALCRSIAVGLERADLAHLVCHGRFRLDSPMFSTLEFFDGGLSLYELERLVRVPSTLILSACDLGLALTEQGDESLGVASALLSAGAATVVVNPAAVPDSAKTAAFMVDAHTRLAAGDTVAEALAWARRRLDWEDPEHLSVGAFLAVGAG